MMVFRVSWQYHETTTTNPEASYAVGAPVLLKRQLQALQNNEGNQHFAGATMAPGSHLPHRYLHRDARRVTWLDCYPAFPASRNMPIVFSLLYNGQLCGNSCMNQGR